MHNMQDTAAYYMIYILCKGTRFKQYAVTHDLATLHVSGLIYTSIYKESENATNPLILMRISEKKNALQYSMPYVLVV